jgi:hypothetical protein
MHPEGHTLEASRILTNWRDIAQRVDLDATTRANLPGVTK